jgi:hypothetical protein
MSARTTAFGPETSRRRATATFDDDGQAALIGTDSFKLASRVK